MNREKRWMLRVCSLTLERGKGGETLQELRMEEWQFWSSVRKDNTAGRLVSVVCGGCFVLF